MPAVSVVLCTHNPRADYLRRTLDGLAAQTLPREQFEVIVVDNASSPAVSAPDSALDLRLVREERLGQIYARVHGIASSSADLVVFVDDDNVLAPDYLACALEIATEHSKLGAWGGQCVPVFDEPAPSWSKRYWGYLAIREFTTDRWSNTGGLQFAPVGAGLCVRRPVAERWARSLDGDPRRRLLGREGGRLCGGDDQDIAFTACDMGMGTGVFTRLMLTHLIPPVRVTEPYLERLLEDAYYSGTVRDAIRGVEPRRAGKLDRLVRTIEQLRMSPTDRRLHRAMSRGKSRALETLARNGSAGPR